MQPYRYTPLPTGSRSTRLVRLLPGSDEAEIRCDIFEFELQYALRSSNFEALSYVWGDVGDRRRIFIEDSCLHVTVNLHTALRYLRDPALDRILWIDAICINQEDLAERSSQVSFMMNIYAAATRVVAWLGEDTSRGESCFTLFKSIARMIRQSQHGRSHGSCDDAYQQLAQNNSFISLLQRPWFNRIWIQQEVAAAQSFVFLYGDQQLAGYTFYEVVNSYRTLYVDDPDSPLLPEQIETQKALWGLHHPVLHLIKWDADPYIQSTTLDILPLRHMVNMFHVHDATDPKDKVYALLGMSTVDASRPAVRVDYSKPWASIFTEIIQYILGNRVLIQTWNHRRIAWLSAKVFPLGRVAHLDRSIDIGKHQITATQEPLFAMCHKRGIVRAALWKLKCVVYGNHRIVREGDIIVQVQGAEQPMVIRRCLDHFEIISITVDVAECRISSRISPWSNDPILVDHSWSARLAMIENYPYELELVWNWEHCVKSSGNEHTCSTTEIGVSLSDHGFETVENSWATQFRRMYNIALLLDDLNDQEGLQSLHEHFKGDLATLWETKPPQNRPAVSAVTQILHARKLSQPGYLWVKQQLFEILGNSMAHLPDYQLHEPPSGWKIKLRSELSNLNLMSETQFFHLIGKLHPDNTECEQREQVLATFLPSQINVTEVLAEKALKLKGHMIRALLNISPPTLTVTKAMLMAASGHLDAESMFEALFEHFPGTSFPETAVVEAMSNVIWDHYKFGGGIFNRTCARVLAHVQFNSETIAEFLALVFSRNGWSMSMASPSSEMWLLIFRPYGNKIAHYVDQTDLSELALNYPPGGPEYLLDTLYYGYREHAKSALMSFSFSYIVEDVEGQAMDIWKGEEEFDAWKKDTRRFWDIFTMADELNRWAAKEIVLESVRAWLLAESLPKNMP
ncbi:HET-domain-containing protein [Karstenula rhodostoma CBS 690.94]|uniref:HET-domain-containing protein n=1 Tax=Karstenula rhodostoma CBS 690.94 TaxID=1392251 RepID=A0A9P4PPW3_9PLEO|nr:HET-domain-containing protein [Karstenula rhodostoma CBS 690.94]